MIRVNCRDALLDAAEAVVLESGAARLTLDAVAEKAGVSKGGLLYHFPTKEALLEGLVTRHLARHDARRAAALEQLPEGPGRELKADLRAVLEKNDAGSRVNMGLLAAVANEPSLMATARERFRRRIEGYAGSGGSFERKTLLLLAAQGLAFSEMLQFSPFSARQRKALVDELMALAEEFAGE
jgi:AcrR family transcriptional regulator